MQRRSFAKVFDLVKSPNPKTKINRRIKAPRQQPVNDEEDSLPPDQVASLRELKLSIGTDIEQ